MHRILTVAAGLFAILALAACGTRPDIASTEKKPGETYSADEVRYRTVDQPFMISGDYFREREQEPSIALDLSGDRSKDSAKKEGMEETGGAAETASAAESEADVRQAERAAPAAARSQSPAAASPQPAPVPPAPLASEETAPPPPAPVKIALIVDEENIAPEISAALPAALIRAAEELPVVVAAPDRVTEVIL
ncbi:MAG: hypothetical protein ACLFPR_17430, partial [Desulfococcaceae bacterium]